MNEDNFQIGDRCLFSFSTDHNISVEIISRYRKNVYWIAPEDQNYRCTFALHTNTFGDKYVFAAHIDHLRLVERPIDDDGVGVDISTLL